MATIPNFKSVPLKPSPAPAANAAAWQQAAAQRAAAAGNADLDHRGRHPGQAALHRRRSAWGRASRQSFPASRRSCAGRTRRCMSAAPGPSGNTPGSRPPRNPTRSTSATWPADRRASASPSICRPIAATTRTILACSAMSAWRAWRSTASSTCASCSTAFRSARSASR